MDGQPLKPLTHGNILIVGAKASNFSEELKSHPRVVIWDSQNEHWTNKELPTNVRAVFVTRWIGHSAFGKIIAEARKRQITMFNPEGTGMITKQVKELLDMNKQPTIIDADRPVHKGGITPKLTVLLPHVDWNKSNSDNARALMQRLDEFNISSTEASIANFLGTQRKKMNLNMHRRNTHPPVVKVAKVKSEDVSVQLLDDAIKGLQDIRAYLLSTVEENTKLRARLDMFKKALEG